MVRKPSKNTQPKLLSLLRLLQVALISLFILTLPILLDMGNTEYGYTKTIFAYMMVTLLYVLWGIQAWLKRELSVHLPTLVWPGIALLVAGGLSLIHATSVGVGLQSLGVLFYFFLIYFYVANNVLDRFTLHLYIGVALLAALFVSSYGLLQYFALLPGLPGVTGTKHAMISSMGNKNFLAEFLNSWFIPSLILLVGLSKRSKGLVLVISAVAFAAFVAADSSGAWLGLLVGAVFLSVGFVFFRNSIKAVWAQKTWLAVWALLLVIAFWTINQPPSLPGFVSETSELPSDTNGATLELTETGLLQNPVQGIIGLMLNFWRTHSGETRSWDWWVALEMFKTHPVFGVGLGHYKVLFVNYKVKFLQTEQGKVFDFYIKRAAQAHNDYVQAAAEMGSVGIAAILFALLTLAWRGVQQLRAQTDGVKQFVCLSLYAGVLAFFFDALVNFPAHLAASSFNVVLLLGVVHSPYLVPKIRTLKLEKNVLRTVVVGFSILLLSISVLAYRDWQANRHLDLGNAFLEGGLYRLAREAYERSLALDFQPAEVLFKLGVVSEALDDRDRALMYYERSLKSFVVEEVFLPLARLKLLTQNYEEARDLLDLLITSKPAERLLQEAELFRALTELRMGNVSKSVAQLKTLEQKYPHWEKVILTLAEAALIQNDPAQAFQHYRAALETVEISLASGRSTWERYQQQLSQGEAVNAQNYSDLRSRIAYLTQQQQEIKKIIDQFSTP